jgi:aspartate aminotransferase
MSTMPSSRTVLEMRDYLSPLLRFTTTSTHAVSGRSDPQACDFSFGNPHDMPLPAVETALARGVKARDKDWFAYKMSEPESVSAVLPTLKARLGIDFDSRDIFMTNGAFGALAASMRSILDPGDEVIYLSPPWFFYVPMLLSLGAIPVRIDLPEPAFELPLKAIAAAITDRTRAVIVNSPHNPSGRIYRTEELERLGESLETASESRERSIYLLSDEAYNRIIFDGRTFASPVTHYRRTMLLYTYGKTLLAPGQRIGYIALPPSMPDREDLRQAIFTAQLATAWAFPNALMQHALADLETASIDVAVLQRRRDRMVAELTEMGYEPVMPEGTFYVIVRSPLADDERFAEELAAEKVFVLPGTVFDLPGWFRISLTANDDMVERALPVFRRVLEGLKTPGRPRELDGGAL